MSSRGAAYPTGRIFYRAFVVSTQHLLVAVPVDHRLPWAGPLGDQGSQGFIVNGDSRALGSKPVRQLKCRSPVLTRHAGNPCDCWAKTFFYQAKPDILPHAGILGVGAAERGGACSAAWAVLVSATDTLTVITVADMHERARIVKRNSAISRRPPSELSAWEIGAGAVFRFTSAFARRGICRAPQSLGRLSPIFSTGANCRAGRNATPARSRGRFSKIGGTHGKSYRRARLLDGERRSCRFWARPCRGAIHDPRTSCGNEARILDGDGIADAGLRSWTAAHGRQTRRRNDGTGMGDGLAPW